MAADEREATHEDVDPSTNAILRLERAALIEATSTEVEEPSHDASSIHLHYRPLGGAYGPTTVTLRRRVEADDAGVVDRLACLMGRTTADGLLEPAWAGRLLGLRFYGLVERDRVRRVIGLERDSGEAV